MPFLLEPIMHTQKRTKKKNGNLNATSNNRNEWNEIKKIVENLLQIGFWRIEIKSRVFFRLSCNKCTLQHINKMYWVYDFNHNDLTSNFQDSHTRIIQPLHRTHRYY